MKNSKELVKRVAK